MPSDAVHVVLDARDRDAVKKVLQRADAAVVSPPALLEPGERTGTYRRGTNIPLADEDGTSLISVEDLAVASSTSSRTPAMTGTSPLREPARLRRKVRDLAMAGER